MTYYTSVTLYVYLVALQKLVITRYVYFVITQNCTFVEWHVFVGSLNLRGHDDIHSFIRRPLF